jgi:8-oxo-dGTP pyrophosphatase MutT (NUDIX family)
MRRAGVGGYKPAEREGITAVIIHGGRLLVLKRRSIPFILDPGEWEFVAGGRKGREGLDETAYREVLEETGLPREMLVLAAKRGRVVKTDAKRTIAYTNALYIFRSETDRVRLNIENSRYRWATYGEIAGHRDYANVFLNERPILKLIRRVLDEEAAEGKAR